MGVGPLAMRRALGRWLLVTSLLMAGPCIAASPSPKVYIFTQDFCPACLAADQYLKQHQIPYRQFNIDHNTQARQVFQKLGAQGTPFLLIGGQPMTGFEPKLFHRLYLKARKRQTPSN